MSIAPDSVRVTPAIGDVDTSSPRTNRPGTPVPATDAVEKLKVFLVSICDGIGGATAAFGDRADVVTHIVECDDAIRSFTQTRLRCTADRFVEEVDIPALVSRVNSATWDVLFLVGGPPVSAL